MAGAGPVLAPVGSLPERDPRTRRRRPLHPFVNLLCFFLTVMTTLIAGTVMTLEDYTWATLLDISLSPVYWTLGLPYSLGVMSILGAHEMGHYLVCRYYRIDASLPFFLPAPHLFGTFGAIIRIRAPITNRRALFDIGVAGPIAGFVVAVPVLLIGLSHSTPIQQPPAPGDIGLASCLLLEILYPLFFDLGPGVSLRLDPLFAAAWLGLLATSLNLLPIGQLDGGHMLYAMSRPLHHVVSRAGVWVLCLGGALVGGWHLVIFGILFAIIGPRHPPLVEERTGLGPGRLVIAFVGLLIFFLSFIPVPLRVF